MSVHGSPVPASPPQHSLPQSLQSFQHIRVRSVPTACRRGDVIMVDRQLVEPEQHLECDRHRAELVRHDLLWIATRPHEPHGLLLETQQRITLEVLDGSEVLHAELVALERLLRSPARPRVSIRLNRPNVAAR